MTSQERPAVFVMEAHAKAALPIIQSLGRAACAWWLAAPSG